MGDRCLHDKHLFKVKNSTNTAISDIMKINKDGRGVVFLSDERDVNKFEILVSTEVQEEQEKMRVLSEKMNLSETPIKGIVNLRETLENLTAQYSHFTFAYKELAANISSTMQNVLPNIMDFQISMQRMITDVWYREEGYLDWKKETSENLGLDIDELEGKIYRTMQDAGYYFPYELLSYISIESNVHTKKVECLNEFVEDIKRYIEFYIENEYFKNLKHLCDDEIWIRFEYIIKAYAEKEWYQGVLALIETGGRVWRLKSEADAYGYKHVSKMNEKFSKQYMVEAIEQQKRNYFFTAYYQGLKCFGNKGIKNRQYKETDESSDCGRHHIAHGFADLIEYNKDLFMQHFSYLLLLLTFDITEIK